MKLDKKKKSRICLACGECCRRYWITILPEESKRISKFLKVSENDFLEKNCVLSVKVFPKTVPGLLTCPSTFFPKKIYKSIEKKLGFSPQSFFVLPQIALKRNGKRCSFLLRGNSCKIYSARPEVCKLFPFIVLPGYRESYPFCGLYRLGEAGCKNLKENRKQFRTVQKYFKKIDKNGFEGVWKTPPKNGRLFLNEEAVGEISISDLNAILAYSNSEYSE
ncbi:MAG: YkgJ family cysteine cluster protein [Candidatus Diapherotrites archaeon]|nr:YkgJ family cysteine cluster protein [Candidatus Diapherotrites archaeon]